MTNLLAAFIAQANKPKVPKRMTAPLTRWPRVNFEYVPGPSDPLAPVAPAGGAAAGNGWFGTRQPAPTSDIERFNSEFDTRLQAAANAAKVLERTTSALKGLESLLGRVQARQAELEQRFEAQFAGGQRQIEAARDRIQAQAQARVAVLLDTGQERLEAMEEQAGRLGINAIRRTEALCKRAVEVLGHDPRQAECSEASAKGSLGQVVAHAEQIVRDANDAAVRLGALGAETRELIARLERKRK